MQFCIVNIFTFILTIWSIVAINLLLVALKSWVKKGRRFERILQKIVNFMVLGIYIRMIIEGSQLVWLSLFVEYKNFTTNSTSKFVSLMISIILSWMSWFFFITSIAIPQASQPDLKYPMLTEFSSGLSVHPRRT